MDAVQSISSADTRILSPEQTRERLQALAKQREELNTEIDTIRSSLDPLLEAVQNIETEQQLLTSPTLEQILQHASNLDDSNTQPHDYDATRADAFFSRMKNQEEIQYWQNVIALHNQNTELMATIANSGIRGWLNGTRKQAQNKLSMVQLNLRYARTEQESKHALQIALDRAKDDPRNIPYDASLHDIKESVFLPQTEQRVLVKFDSWNFRGGNTVTLQLPTSPEDTDFLTTVTFKIDDDDLNAFINFSFEMEHQLAPFPLEVVQVDGKDRIRIPQSIWERIKDYVVKE